jgi:alkanesulfonate monooxygenase SsuD/methylene tetrahydromethanopterin reductase-like flavin-dependent oxidoreductase (luciferase family)
MGGSAEASLARAARTGDGHIFAGSTDRHFEGAERLLELLAEHGRDPGSFGMDLFVDFADGPEVWHDRAARWEALGGTLVSVRAMTTGTSFLGVAAANLSTPEQHLRALEQFMTEMSAAGAPTGPPSDND